MNLKFSLNPIRITEDLKNAISKTFQLSIDPRPITNSSSEVSEMR